MMLKRSRNLSMKRQIIYIANPNNPTGTLLQSLNLIT